MTLQSSGPISIGNINTELGRASNTANTSLDTAENGGYGTINTASPSFPSSTNPAAISEWYSYNHLASTTYTANWYDCTCTLVSAVSITTSCAVSVGGWYQGASSGQRLQITGTGGTGADDTITNCTNYGSCAATPCV